LIVTEVTPFMSNQVVVFFLHAYNEIDHISPIIYKWLESRDVRTEVVLTGIDNLPGDYRIALLEEYDHANIRFGADIVGADRSVQTYAPPDANEPTNYMDWRTRVNESVTLSDAVKHLGRKIPTDIPKRIWRRYRTEPQHPLQWLADDATEIFETVVGNADEAVICFDWANAEPDGKKPRITFTHRILQHCHENGFKTVAWPHGDNNFRNALYLFRSLETFLSEYDEPCDISSLYAAKRQNIEHARETMNVHDYWVIPNESLRPSYEPVIDGERLVALGSPRYNQEWTDMLSRNAPRYRRQSAEGKLNVVVLLQTDQTLMMQGGIKWALRFLSAYPAVNLTVKAHTRLRPEVMNLVGPDGELVQEFPDLEVVYNDIHTTSLVQWSDVVVDMGTSAAFEAFVRNKEVLHFDFLHGYEPLVTNYFPDTRMASFDDVHEAICRSTRNPEHRSYTTAERESFLAEMVAPPNGTRGEELQEYVKFIDSILEAQ
jgi:hypothetical protein